MKLPAVVAHLLGRHGDLVALESGALSWSYAELDGETRERAALLRRLCPAGGRVVLVGDHTAEALIWALAVMRAGLVHTPLNPGLPLERLRDAVGTAGPGLVLCEAPVLRSALREQVAPITVLGPEELTTAAAEAAAPGDGPVPGPPPEVAYSIFTSGSTGVPKLVNVGHAGIETLCREQTRLFGIGPGARVLQFSSLSFDASIAEILVGLHAGARLVVPTGEGASWLSTVGTHLREHGCDVITLPPSVYARLADEARKGIGTVVFAGEALPEAEFRAATRYSRVLNAYGPTEGTVCFSVAEPTRFSTSVGRPLDGYLARVHDAEQGTYATSGHGELVLVGPGVALGYEGVPRDGGPFTTLDGSPAYHTGDRVELRDGEIFYLGRTDEQVKRLGHRIDLTELSGRTAQLLDASVILAEDDGALVLAHTATAHPEAALKARLRGALAAWEVPDVLLALSELPVTDNGKADKAAVRALARQAARRPDAAADTPAADARTARDDLATVHAVVAGVLGTGIEAATSVFDAGGDSLTLVRIQVELSEIYGEDTVQSVFDRLSYDFTVDSFLTGLGSLRADAPASGADDGTPDGTAPGPPAPDPVAGVLATVSAELATLPAELAALRPAPAGDGERPRPVVLTGAAGFIGGHVLDRLLSEGRRVTVVTTSDVDDLVARHRTRFDRESADFADVGFLRYDDLATAVGRAGADRWGPVVHCGFEVNHLLPLERQLHGSIASTRALVRAAAAGDAPRFVFLSAASVGTDFAPLTEAALTGIDEPYSQAKFLAEGYVGALMGDRCRVDLVRAGLVYGHTGSEGSFLDRDVFTQILRLSLRHGVLPRLKGGVPLCHVDDVVSVLLAAADSRGPARASLLVQRTYDAEELRTALGLGHAQVVDQREWLATLTRAGTAEGPLLAAFRQWTAAEGWSERVRATDRPIIQDLLTKHLGA